MATASRIMKIAILTNIIPPYREDFYDRIFYNQDFEIIVYCQNEIPGSNIKSIHSKYPTHTRLINYYSPFGNEKLVFQFYPFFSILKKYDIIVVDGNLKHLLLALYSTAFKILGKKVIIWSNVQSVGRNPLHKLRIFWWRFFNNFLMYTKEDKIILLLKGFTNKIIEPINNGLNQDGIDLITNQWNESLLQQFKSANNINSHNIIISSGRVNKSNQHIVALSALVKIKKEINDILWIIVGAGSELDLLKDQSERIGLNENILFLGEMYDETVKCPWFLISKFLVHPGPIGLSLLNAFGYSLPVITHSNAAEHGPEFSIFENGKTGVLFKIADSDDLAEKVVYGLRNPAELYKIKKNCYNIVHAVNNTRVMAEQFFKILQIAR